MSEIFHKAGGTITKVTAIGHETYKGVADWFYIGDVTWNDGSSSKGLRIAPFNLCCHGDDAASRERLLDLSRQLNQYLEEVGEWHETKSKRDGRVYNWTPKEKEGRREL